MPTALNQLRESCILKVLLVFWLLIISAGTTSGDEAQVERVQFQTEVQPVLAEFCFRCHGPEKQQSDVRLDSLNPDFLNDSRSAETWHDVLGAIQRGEMPPKDEPRPSDEQRRGVVDWLARAIDRAVDARPASSGRGALRRLNRVEYQNTMRDLLGVDIDYSSNLPPDSVSEDGFKNNGATLSISAMQLETYLQAARAGLEKAIVSGPSPRVFCHILTEGTADGGRSQKGLERSNTLGRNSLFLAHIEDEYPDEGEFLIRVRARAELVAGHGLPRLQVSLGFRADTELPHRVVDAIDVEAEEIAAYEFRGRLENFPLPSRTQSKFPGILIKLENLYDDGSALPDLTTEDVEGAGKKKRKKKNVSAAEVGLPQLHIESLEFIAPHYDSWPPKYHTAILFNSSSRTDDPRGYARQVLERFMHRAFRRPASAAQVRPFLTYFDRLQESSPTFEAAMRETLAMVLTSPEFIYIIEPARQGKRHLDDWEIASRLSYFLWSSMPDEKLFAVCASGGLSDTDQLSRVAATMLDDSRSWQFIDQFVDQWLDVSGVDRVAVNPDFYPQWDDALKPSIRAETKHFFAEILHQRLSALNFLDSDFAMLNGPLARHYGLPAPQGLQFSRVSLDPESQRGGLLGQASVLLGNSTGEDSHPVKRAVWIRSRLLGDPPAPPPPNVPNLDADNVDFAQLSVRQQLEAHREQESCNDCHRGIDPWGIALEEFGADGLWRESIPRRHPEDSQQMLYRPTDSRTTLPDGTQVSGLRELKAYLTSEQREPFARVLVHKMLTYALGRSLELTDEPAIEKLTHALVASDYELRQLVLDIVVSEPFLTK